MRCPHFCSGLPSCRIPERQWTLWIFCAVLLASTRCVGAEPPVAEPPVAEPPVAEPPVAKQPVAKSLILAHYMPWYEAKPASKAWGWHWTMNAFDPDKMVDGRREIASHYDPLIGPYDSGDPDVLEFHLLTMKIAGIDGVIVDWYGLQDFRDYPLLHRSTQRLIDQADRLGMKFAICYEDQTIPALVEAGRIEPEGRVGHAVAEIQWMAQHWFPQKHYVHLDGRPVLLSFGHSGLSDQEWSECLERSAAAVAYFSEHQRRTAAVGAFDWPVPNQGIAAVERFEKQSREWPQSIPVAFPRFVDVYAEAKVHASWGRIEDDQGRTFRDSMKRALMMEKPLVQIATWNDWGEGTCVEPSRQFGYRDLQALQQLRRQHLDPEFAAAPADLRLPLDLLRLRRSGDNPQLQERCDRIAKLLANAKYRPADNELASQPPELANE